MYYDKTRIFRKVWRRSMAELKKIWINTINMPGKEHIEIRLDWVNDRHQAVKLNSLAIAVFGYVRFLCLMR